MSDGARRRDRGAYFGSIYGTLNHILLGDRLWLGRIADAIPELDSMRRARLLEAFRGLDVLLYDEFSDYCQERQHTDDTFVELASELGPEQLSRPVRYRDSAGDAHEYALWLTMAHLFNHQAHHRGQVTTLMSQSGVDPGTTDLLFLEDLT